MPTAGISLHDAADSDDATAVPKLAYTPTNAPLHVYYEELSRILTKLDGVQSGGHEDVRLKRRELARRVEREAERVERIRVLVWRAWSKKRAGEQPKEMEVDQEQEVAIPESVAVPESVEEPMIESTVEPTLSEPTAAVVGEPLEAQMDVDTEHLTSAEESSPATAPSPSPEQDASLPTPTLDDSSAHTHEVSPLVHTPGEPEMSVEPTAHSEPVPALVVDHPSDAEVDGEAPQTPPVAAHAPLPEESKRLSTTNPDLHLPPVSQEWEEVEFF